VLFGFLAFFFNPSNPHESAFAPFPMPLFSCLPQSRIQPFAGCLAVHLRSSRQAYLTDEIPRLGVQGAASHSCFSLLALALCSSLATCCRDAESGSV
jgi:hypothetical protein